MLAASLALAAPATGQATGMASAERPRAEIATLYSVFPGYGVGHFLVGDHEAGMRFLVLDLAATALWMVGPSVVALAEGTATPGAMATAPSAAANAVFAIGLLAQGGLKIWEVSSARAFVLEPSGPPGDMGGKP